MSWIFISIFATFLWAFCNVIDKYVLSQRVFKPVVLVAISAVVGLAFSLIVFFKQGLAFLPTPQIILALLVGVVGAAWLYLYFKAMAVGEVSRIVPVMYLSPVFIALFAWLFLGEILPSEKYLGILFLIAGAIFISLKLPFSWRPDKAFWLIIVATIIASISQIIQKYLLGFADFWTIFTYIRVGFFLAALPIIIFYFSNLVAVVKGKGMKLMSLQIANDSISNVGTLIFTFAVAVGSVTLTNAIASTQPFFVLLLATLLGIFFPKILKEEMSRSVIGLKVAAVAVIFIGGLLIS